MSMVLRSGIHTRRLTFIIILFSFSTSFADAPVDSATVEGERNIDSSVISTSSSPFARLHGIPPRAVTLGDGFWKKRFETNMNTSIPTFLMLLNEIGARDKLLGRKNKARGNSDADLAKWLEAASFVLQSQDNEKPRTMLQSVVNDILLSSADGGYLQTRHLKKCRPGLLNQIPLENCTAWGI
jgi:hypothetical protein